MSGGDRPADLFLVGAPKCGTTSLYHWLSQHPDVYFPARKELNRFGADLGYHRPCSPDDYRAHFAGRGRERYGGDASVFHLYSESAPREIYDYSPDARIVALVRDPVDAMYSLYFQLRVAGVEPSPDFATAVDRSVADADAAVPPHALHDHVLRYREIVRFASQIERYNEVFPPGSVHVVVFDDLVSDPGSTYRALLAFLDLPDDGREVFPTRNPTTDVRSAWLRDRVLNRPGSYLGRTDRSPVTRAGRVVERTIRRLNTVRIEKPTLAAPIRTRLVADGREDVGALAALLDRDLTAWLEVAGRVPDERPDD